MNNVLGLTYLITIPADDEELADLLYEEGIDWETTLYFLERVAKKQNVIINIGNVSRLIAEKFKEN